MEIRARPKGLIFILKTIMTRKWEQNERATFSDLHDSASDSLGVYRVVVKKSEERQGCKQQGNNALAARPVDWIPW